MGPNLRIPAVQTLTPSESDFPHASCSGHATETVCLRGYSPNGIEQTYACKGLVHPRASRWHALAANVSALARAGWGLRACGSYVRTRSLCFERTHTCVNICRKRMVQYWRYCRCSKAWTPEQCIWHFTSALLVFSRCLSHVAWCPFSLCVPFL